MSEVKAKDEHEAFMREALVEARKACALFEVPVGCIVVKDGEIIARAHNLRESSQDPTAHAEIIALKAAARKLNCWRLSDVTVYVTLEPCPMCAGALVNSRVSTVVYGCDDPKAGALRSLYSIGSDDRLNHRFHLLHGILSDSCSSIISNFFSEIRLKERNRCSHDPSPIDTSCPFGKLPSGELTERPKVLDSKSSVPLRVPWVRIPRSPQK